MPSHRSYNALPPAQMDGAEGIDALYEACRLIAAKLGMDLCRPPHTPGSAASAQHLRHICNFGGLYSRKILLRGSWWRRDQGPLLAFLQAESSPGHKRGTPEWRQPVALLPASASRYEVVDPQTGATVEVDTQAALRICECAFMLYPAVTGSIRGPGEFLGPSLRGYWRDLVVILLMAIAAGLLSTLIPLVTGVVYGKTLPNGDRSELGQMALVLIAAGFGACGFQITRALSALRLTGKLDIRLQPLIWSRLLALPISFFRHYTTGDLADRVRGIGTIRQFLLTDVTTAALALVSSATSFVLLFYYSWRLALLASSLLLLFLAAMFILSVMQVGHQSQALNAQGKLSSLVFGFIQAISKLRTSGAELRAYNVWLRQFSEQNRHLLRARHLGSVQTGLTAFYLIACELALFAAMGASLRKHLPLSTFLAFSAAFGQIQTALLTFIATIPELLSMIPIYRRLQPVLQEPAEAAEGKIAADLGGDVAVDNVSFRYQENGPLILDGVSVRASRGEFIAIVGPSGSGKSTLIRLLLGFEQPFAGSVRYDGQDLEMLDPKSVRRQIGTVLQNSSPFTGDIFSSITGSNGGDLAEAWEAARVAGIDEEIKRMPMGMHTVITEGAVNFSGGERQRLMIARAVAGRPQILLLDEATSALDKLTQDRVETCLDTLRATRIVVAHRLSTVRRADRIYVLDGGRIVQEGTYDELTQRAGYFELMMRRQV